MDYWTTAALLFLAGTAAGTVNVIAGGGSMLTLPLMIFLGLPASVANGTNRVAIVVQNIGAVSRFRRHGLIDWGWLPVAAIPALAGAAAGSWLALRVDDASFQRILAVLMVGIALWTIWDPLKGRERPAPEATAPPRTTRGRVALALGFLLIGIYGGFVQAGVGFLILAALTLAGLDLVRGNALKALVVLSYMPLSLAIFALDGKVDWGMGIALAAGNLLGALIGVRLTVLKGHAWIQRVVTVMIVLFAIRLLTSA